jgi:uncharacterized protein (DUF1800 family)
MSYRADLSDRANHLAGVERPTHVSRRAALGLGAFAVAGTMLASRTRSGARAAPPEIEADVDPGSLITKFVNRITFGANADELALANSLGFQGYLDYQLDHLNIDDSAVETRIASGVAANGSNPAIPALPTVNRSGTDLYDTTITTNQSVIATELMEATMVRAAFSRRQLYQRMVEFWSDHFNLDITLDNVNILKTLDDRLVVRPNALGTFPALLNASARSPAMMTYLNNDQNKNNSINENYAREVLELHTVGVTAGYSQDDIVKVARCLTGWDWYRGNDANTALRGTFRYNSASHDTQAKQFLGSGVFAPMTIPARTAANGQQDFQDILDILAVHPKTALFVATKLCKRFIGDNCPQGIINAVRDTYLNPANPQGIGDIKAMLRTMLTPNNIYSAPLKYKRPFHLFISTIRAMGPLASINTTGTIRTQLTKAGHALFSWGPPDGYPDTTEYWSGLILPRWNWCASVAVNGVSGVTMNASGTGGLLTSASTASAIMNVIDQTIFAGEMNPSEKARIQSFLPASGTITTTQKNDALGLAFSSPQFQWH